MSESAKRRCTPEWRAAQSKRLETPLDTQQIKNMYESGMTQDEIADALGTTQKVIWRHIKKYGISARIARKRDQFADKNHMWKGAGASYKAFHLRVKNVFGPAKEYGCSICGRHDNSASYDWANLTGHYEDIRDYAPMCRSCHRQYDKKKRGDVNAI